MNINYSPTQSVSHS